MTKKRTLLFCATVSLIVFATSCQLGRTLHIFNNTGDSVTVTASTAGYSESKKIGDKRSATFRWLDSLSIQSGTNNWKYSLLLLSSDCFERRHFGYHLFIQLQNNGTLYVMANGANEVVTNFPKQPKGCPLIPNK